MKLINKFNLDKRIKIYGIIGLFLFSLLFLTGFLLISLYEVSMFFKIIFLVLFILFLLFLYLCNRIIILPFKKIERYLQQYIKGHDYDILENATCYFSDAMEMSYLKNKEQLYDQKSIQQANKYAEYLALQNQINPHFLYNILEAIRGDAISEGVEDIADIIEALATFFRYTISNVEHLVTIEEEISNVLNYFNIQKFRFGDKINIDIKYEEESHLQYKIPKLTMQPIIENAIVHGLEYKVGKGIVNIDIHPTTSRIIINIQDDGIGIDKEKVKKINEKLYKITVEKDDEEYASSGGIALTNVSNRIKLLFGEKYGIRLSSVVNFGTNVEITLPFFK